MGGVQREWGEEATHSHALTPPNYFPVGISASTRAWIRLRWFFGEFRIWPVVRMFRPEGRGIDDASVEYSSTVSLERCRRGS